LSFAPDSGRYHIHELLRLYGAAYLENEAELLNDHCAYTCQWLGEQEDSLMGPEQMLAINQVKSDLDNIYAAISHAIRNQRLPDLKAALPSLGAFFRFRGMHMEGITLIQRIHRLLSRRPEVAPGTLYWATILLCDLYGLIMHTSRAEPYFEKASQMLIGDWFKGQDTRAERAALLLQEGYLLFQKDPATAVIRFQQGAEIAASIDDRSREAEILLGLGRAARNADNLDIAWPAAEKSLTLYRSLGNPQGQIIAEISLGNLLLADGRFNEAEELMNECINRLRPFNNPEALGWALFCLAMAQAYSGRFQVGLISELERQRLYEGLDSPLQTRAFESFIRLHMGHYEECTAIAQDTLREARATGKKRVIHDGLRLLGLLALIRGDAAAALVHFRDSREFAIEGLLTLRFIRNGLLLGMATAISGEPDAARQLIVAEIKEALEQGVELRLGIGLAGAACLETLSGRPEQALVLYSVAQQYPFVANSQWFADVVGKRITAATVELSSGEIEAAVFRGQELDMWAAVRLFLEEDSAPGAPISIA
jgi:tetratricopeptide (TPR) repeat protein